MERNCLFHGLKDNCKNSSISNTDPEKYLPIQYQYLTVNFTDTNNGHKLLAMDSCSIRKFSFVLIEYMCVYRFLNTKHSKLLLLNMFSKANSATLMQE